MKKLVALGATSSAVLALSACDPEINVREKWGKNIANFGLRGVYPMVEDLAPGDIFVYVPNACGSYIPRSSEARRVGALPGRDIQRAMEQYYGSRPHFPATKPPSARSRDSSDTTTNYPAGRFSFSGQGGVKANIEANAAGTTVTKSTSAAGSGSSEAPPVDSPEATAADPIYSSSPRGFTRLRMAALPNISLYNSIGASAGGSWNWISAAIAGQDARKVRVSATRVEMAEIPSIEFLKIVASFMNGPDWPLFQYYAKGVATMLKHDLAADPKCPYLSNKQPELMFVNNVYYTRTLVYEYADDGAFAARLAATAPTVEGAAAPAAPFNPPALATTSPSNPAQTSAQALLVGLAQMSGGPGAGFNFALGYSGNIELSQTWARPMAFATQHAYFIDLDYNPSKVDASKGGQPAGTENSVTSPTPPPDAQPLPTPGTSPDNRRTMPMRVN